MRILRPTLILDQSRALKNIETIARKVKKSSVRFRPHFKTHQSAQIGDWFRKVGVKAITVSSVQMGVYFSQNGWKDITIAFPVNRLEIEEINELGQQVDLHLLVESKDTVSFLNRELKQAVNLWIKIDTGYKRTGIDWDNLEEITGLAKEIAESAKLNFKGLLTHSGHSYNGESPEAIKAIYHDTVFKMNQVRQRLSAQGFFNVEISIGDTPGCSLADHFHGIDEVRCGNFVFYDVMQLFLGSCKEKDIAVALACPVVARYPAREELVIYGGAVHLSNEYVKDSRGRKIFGLIALLQGSSWGLAVPDTYVCSLSQEHGIIKTSPAFLNQVKPGDILMILPVHSCLVVNLMRQYQTLSGDIIKTALSC